MSVLWHGMLRARLLHCCSYCSVQRALSQLPTMTTSNNTSKTTRDTQHFDITTLSNVQWQYLKAMACSVTDKAGMPAEDSDRQQFKCKYILRVRHMHPLVPPACVRREGGQCGFGRE